MIWQAHVAEMTDLAADERAEIMNAVYDAYHSMLFVNKHPVIILSLTLDPTKIDVNVHPAKTEIKIEQKEEICNAVLTALQQTLKKNNLIPFPPHSLSNILFQRLWSSSLEHSFLQKNSGKV